MPQPCGSCGQTYGLPYPAAAGHFHLIQLAVFPAFSGARGTENSPTTSYQPYPMSNPSHSGFNRFFSGVM